MARVTGPSNAGRFAAGSARRRVRVLVVGPTPPPYHGGSVSTSNLLQCGLGETFELIHLDTSDRRDLANTGRFDLTNVWLAAAHGVRFMRLLLGAKPDIVYVPIAQNRLGFLRDCLFLVPARMLGKRTVIHIHGGYFGTFVARLGSVGRWSVKRALAGVARVIVLGESLRPMLAGVVREERIAVVPNGVPDPGVPRAERSGGRRCVVFLGTLTRSKGFIDVLDAARLLKSRTDVEFVLAGPFHTEEDRAAAEPLRRELGDAVQFPGTVTGRAKDRLLAEADVFVFPTYYPPEGHPLVILEAMAAGLPIIATDQGAILETVRDGENGIIVGKRNGEAVAAAVAALLDDDELRRRMGARSRQLYEAEYAVDRWADRMADVFRGALPKPAE